MRRVPGFRNCFPNLISDDGEQRNDLRDFLRSDMPNSPDAFRKQQTVPETIRAGLRDENLGGPLPLAHPKDGGSKWTAHRADGSEWNAHRADRKRMWNRTPGTVKLYAQNRLQAAEKRVVMQ